MVTYVGLDVLRQSVTRLIPGGEHDERLDHVAAPFVRYGNSRRLGDGRALDTPLAHLAGPLARYANSRPLGEGRVLQTRRFHLERADPITGRDDHVIGATLVPVVAVLVGAGRVLGVKPLTTEHLL